MLWFFGTAILIYWGASLLHFIIHEA